MNIGLYKGLTAFDESTIGTKVIGQGTFLQLLTRQLENQDWPDSGIVVVEMTTDSHPLVRTGVAFLEGLTKEDLHIRQHRGEWLIFATPDKAAPVRSVNCIVYTMDAYANDPQSDQDDVNMLKSENTTHVLVAVLADVGTSKPPLSSHRLVRNIAGGNREWVPSWLNAESDLRLLSEIQDEAIKAVQYEKTFITVADVEDAG